MIGFGLFLAHLGSGSKVSAGAQRMEPWPALALDFGLVALFCLHHSLLARSGAKQRLRRLVGDRVERSLYVLAASLLLIALVEWWQPVAQPALWRLEAPAPLLAIRLVSLGGWTLALLASLQIGHGRLFGFRPTLQRLFLAPPADPDRLVTHGLYGWSRHPIYVGSLIAIWACPVAGPSHLLLAGSFTAYILLGARWEERDLADTHGERYRNWVATTPRFLIDPARRYRRARR